MTEEFDPETPPNTVRDGEEMCDPEEARKDTETIHVDMRSSASEVPDPGKADSRLEELRARGELDVLLPEERAELHALEEGLDPETYTFEDRCRDRGLDEEEIEVERELVRSGAEDRLEGLRSNPHVDVDV
jgi:hypothetical protein